MSAEKAIIETMPNGIETFGTLGRKLSIPVKTKATVYNEGYSVEFKGKSVAVSFGIGKDHTAQLVMSLEAWEAFKNGDEPIFTTLNEFKKNFL